MGDKRDRRQLRQRVELDRLIEEFRINDKEFNYIIDRIEIVRLPLKVQTKVRKLYNALVFQ